MAEEKVLGAKVIPSASLQTLKFMNLPTQILALEFVSILNC